jgi:UDP-glucose 4-epimerase
VELDIADAPALDALFAEYSFDAVFHFASFIQVGESVSEPGRYYQNNVAATLVLLQAMVRAGVRRLIFSSTAAVYGDPQYVPIDEQHPKAPINPYGCSKWMVEQVLQDFDRAYGLRSVCLRYFNAAGADPEGECGERHEPETHLIPLILQAASGRRPAITVFGRDYDTPDGTCIRDYIHVADLASAHALAVDYLIAGGASTAFNLGNGLGFSVQQVIDTVRDVTGREVRVEDAPRRAGDPPRLVADAGKARQLLGWQPVYGSLEAIVRHAWNWEKIPWD